MKKFPIQFTFDTISLAGILLFVFWTTKGGLKAQISQLFELRGNQQHATNKIGHIGDLLFYYANFVGTITVLWAAFYLSIRLFPKIGDVLPSFQKLLKLLLQIVQNLIIFVGIYVYLLHQDGMGLKKQKILLFPFWFVTTLWLDILGKVISSLQTKVDASSAGYGLMLAHIAGYKPFKLI